MAPNKLKFFDVRRRQRYSNGERTEIPREQSINLMCFLLRGISYQKLYGDKVVPIAREHVFDILIRNAGQLPEDLWVDADGDAYGGLIQVFTREDKKTGTFDRVKILIDDYNDTHNTNGKNSIILGELFWKLPAKETKPALRTVKKEIVNALYAITDGKPEMRHFCAPFVPIQRGVSDPVKKTVFEEFLKQFHDKNIEYFYTTGGTTDDKRVARNAREAGILNEKKMAAKNARQEPGIVTKGDGNSKHCSGGRCADCGHSDHWCEEVYVDGQWVCSLGSDNG